MCGIFGYIGRSNKAAQIVLDGLKRLEYRGYDSWGIGVKYNSRITIDKHTGKIGQATVNLPSSYLGCGHTRWATHGGVSKKNAHPHLDCTKKIALMHNGIVENYLKLKKRLIQKGHKFISETDTEVIVHLIEEQLKQTKEPVEATRKAFLQLEGRNAIIAMFSDYEMIVVAKNGSPIVLGLGAKENFIASDAAALLPHTRQVIFLEDNHLASIEKHQVREYDLTTGKIVKSKKQKLTWKIEEAEKGPYPHFLLKEIMDQGKTIADAASQSEKLIKSFCRLIENSFGTYLVGCGTAAHACRTGTYIFSIIAKKHTNFCVGSEFAYFEDFLTPNSLLLAASQSGETADILEAVKAARRHKSRVAALVNVIGSTLDREADATLPLRAGPEKAVLSTKAFTAKLTLFFLLAYTLAGQYRKGRRQLLKTAEAASKLLADKTLHNTLKTLAKKIYKQNDIYILGRGLSFPLALEAAHKIKEASYIHAEGFAGGEPKHCEISLVEKNTPTIVFVPNDETRAAILSNAIEFRSRGAFIIGISPKHHEEFHYWIKVPDIGITSTITNIIPAQLLAYYLAIEKGTDPDKPRNLAKSVTVK